MAADDLEPTVEFEQLPAQRRPDHLRYRPECWSQQRAYESETSELLYSGILGCGKTRVLCEKADTRCRDYAPARVAIARLHREHIGPNIIPELKRTVTPAEWETGYKTSEDGGATLHYDTGSRITLLGIDNPHRWQSTDWDMILIEQAEEIDQEHWDFVTGRCGRNAAWKLDDEGMPTDVRAYAQTGAFCNPDGPTHFLFTMFRPDLGSHKIWTEEPTLHPWGEVIPPGELIREVIVADLRDNRKNLDPQYLRMLARKKGNYYQRMVLGLWVAFEGLVYNCWDANASVVRQRPKSWDQWGGYPPPSWERLRGCDMGYHPDPFVFQWWVRLPNGDALMYREIYKRDTLTSDHAKVINREEEKELAALRHWAGKHGHDVPRYLNVVGSFADHDRSELATLESENVVMDRAVKDRSPGIQTVYELLMPGDLRVTPDGRATRRSKLMFGAPEWTLVERDQSLIDARLPSCTIEEFNQYRWNDEKVGKEVAPTLGADHGCDTVRYIFHTLYARKDPRAILI